MKAYDISNPTAPVLTRTLNVQEAAEDECSTPVYAKSVQSVAVVNVANYGTTVIAAAVVSRDRLTNGALIFYKGDTLEYLDCQPTGVGPESIVSDGTSKIVVANEGFDGRTEAFDGTVNPDGTANYEFTSGDMQDPVGSITVCTATASSSTSISFSCLDRDLRPSYVTGDESYCTGCSDSGCTAVADRIASYQASGIRLFGPGLQNSGDIFSAVMEPEGIAITDDGAYIMCVFQDNNAYGIYDVSAQKWKKLGGLGTIEMTMDPSDRDDAINIRNSWGSDNTRAYVVVRAAVRESHARRAVTYSLCCLLHTQIHPLILNSDTVCTCQMRWQHLRMEERTTSSQQTKVTRKIARLRSLEIRHGLKISARTTFQCLKVKM